MVSQKEIDKVFKKFKNATNMTAQELRIWRDNPKSREASLSREPIRRNLRLLSTPKSKWGAKEVKDANKTISYLARAKEIPRAKGVPRNKLTDNEIALRNWSYDVFKDRKTQDNILKHILY